MATVTHKFEIDRKERKVIPLFYYVAAAASIALLFSLYILFNDNTSEQKFAATTNNSIKQIQNNKSNVLANEIVEKEKKNTAEPSAPANNTNQVAVKSISTPDKKENKKTKTINAPEKDSVKVAPEVNQQPQNSLANNIIENKKEENIITPDNQPIITNSQKQKANNQEAIAKSEKKTAKEIPNDFLSLRELAAKKIKEKILDKNTVAAQKKEGKDKKITGWDVAQIVTKGISKITGYDVEVSHSSNKDEL